MSDNGFSLIKLNGASDVVLKLFDMIKDAIGWIATPHGSKKDFEDALVLYKKSIEDGNEAEGIIKAAKISTAKKELKQYINKRNIIAYTISDLKDNAKMDVDNDWLAYFFSYAENISDKSIQMIWSRILAEQCNGDTSIKRTLIHILSLIDAKTALSFGNLCKLTIKYPQMSIYEHLGTKFVSEFIPLVINPKLSGLNLVFPKEDERYQMALEYRNCIPEPNDIAILQEIGLIELSEKRNNNFEYPYAFGLISHDYSGKGNRYKGSKIQDYVVEYNDVKYKVMPKAIDDYSDLSEVQNKLPENIKFGLIKFTTVGETLYKLLKPEKILGFESIFKLYMESQDFKIEKID